MHIKNILAPLCIFCIVQVNAQKSTINILDSGRNTSIRGLSVVTNEIIWASGSNGTVARSTDGGKTFEWLSVKGYEQRDFRDIEAFDANTAIIMGIAEPAIILKTKDAGKSWYKVFEDTTKGMFLDAMDFTGNGTGVVIGDPVTDFAFCAITIDGGENWTAYKNKLTDKFSVSRGEAFFASSGSNIKFVNRGDVASFIFATGGMKSRLFYREKYYDLDINQGAETTGANSIAIDKSGKNAIIVGGDFKADTSTFKNCVLLSLNTNPEFSVPQTPPHGYRSCVEYITKKKLVACGTSGVDVSNDGGLNWQLISVQSFHVCQKAKNGSSVFLAGANGKIAKLEY